jgi:hypothetical protein
VPGIFGEEHERCDGVGPTDFGEPLRSMARLLSTSRLGSSSFLSFLDSRYWVFISMLSRFLRASQSYICATERIIEIFHRGPSDLEKNSSPAPSSRGLLPLCPSSVKRVVLVCVSLIIEERVGLVFVEAPFFAARYKWLTWHFANRSMIRSPA